MLRDNDHDSILARGFDEALACRDMLEPAPTQPSLLARSVRWCISSALSFGQCQLRRAIPAAPSGTGTRQRLWWADVLRARAFSELIPPSDGQRAARPIARRDHDRTRRKHRGFTQGSGHREGDQSQSGGD
jgi:hypothetical protein